MASNAAPATGSPAPPASDPFRAIWRLLINVKFAVALVSLAALASLIGVVVPQLPAEMRSNPAARSAWLELQRDDFGIFTNLMDRLDLFDVFQSPWFLGLWVVIVVAVTVCTISRFPPTWRSVQRPPLRVGGRYYDTAKHRAAFTHQGGAGAVEALLRKRRYRVTRTRAGEGVTELFAERYAWSQYATFASHLALLMLLVGGLLTNLAGFQRTLALAEARPAAPLFDDPGPGQIFVQMEDAHRGVDAAGNIIDFHSDLHIRRGTEEVTCTATVNGPCSAFGYRFHQAAFFDDLAHLTVWGPDGRLLFDDILDFENEATAVPALTVTDREGDVLFDQALPQMASVPGAPLGFAGDLGLAELVVPGAIYGASWRTEDDTLVLVIDGEGIEAAELRPGGFVETAVHRIVYRGIVAVPAITVLDMPRGEASGHVTVQMPEGGDGEPYLFVSNVDATNLAIEAGETIETSAGYRYRFGGRVDASGIDVRRDPGDTFIWIAVVMALVGLAVTFYIPRRRLWVRVTPTRTQLAGVAERTTRFGRELRRLGAELGARDALLPGDVED